MQASESGIGSMAPTPVGVILAGGRSRRMGGGDKALAPLAGKPMVQHVIVRLAPQVAELVLSVERESRALAEFGLPLLPDARAGHQGPVSGLLAAMRHFAGQAKWLLLAPCDAPFLPHDLASRLRTCAEAAGASAAVVASGGELQPTFSLWRIDLLRQLERAVQATPRAGIKAFLRAVTAAHCNWPTAAAGDEAAANPPPFFNVNDPPALERASRWLEVGREAGSAC
jgi:molybdopterin-guanine dinucleotide biosynthesis protein A